MLLWADLVLSCAFLCFFCSIISFCSSLAAVGFIWVCSLLPLPVKITS